MVEVSPRAATTTRLRLLDGLRLVAALSVLLFHYTSLSSTVWGTAPWRVFPFLSGITAYGGLGVQLFFMISGFVVLMSAWGRTSSAFVGSRIGRLFPAYWFGVLTTGALLAVARPTLPDVSWEQVGVKGVLVNLTMVQQPFRIAHVDGVYWTLWEEAKFYVVVLLLTLIGITARRVLLVAVLWPVLALVVQQTGVPVVGAVVNVNTAAFFAVGMVLFLGYRDGFSAPVLAALVWTMLLVQVEVLTFVVPLFDRYVHAPLQPAIVMLSTVAMVAVILTATTTRLAALPWRWLSVAGALTYPLYLLHDNWGLWFISWLHPFVPPLLLVALLAVFFCVVAWFVHVLVERRLGPVLRRTVEQALTPVEKRLRRRGPARPVPLGR